MAIAFRSEAHTTYAARSDTACNAPAGLANGDIMVACLILVHGSSFGDDVTPPAGWTQIGTMTTMLDSSGNTGHFYVWWKRASSEGASYTFAHTATHSTQAAIAAYSGCLASGDPVDVSSQNSAANTGSLATATGVTTTVASTKLLYIGHNWDATGTLTPPTGMTERFDLLVYLSDEDRASAGATSNRTQTLSSSNWPWSAFLVAIKPAAGASTYTLSAVAGSYAMTGVAATPKHGWKPTAAAGSYGMTGTDATLTKTGAGARSLPPRNPTAFLPFLVR